MSKGGQVRVVAGSAGGLWIRLPKGFTSRPTQDRVKQAIFSSLGDHVPGAVVLDLYAGSGSLGIEALSRGAAACTLVDRDRSCTDTIMANLAHCRLEGRVVTRPAEAYTIEADLSAFTLVLLDPPYAKNPGDLALDPVARNLSERLSPGTLIVWEHARHSTWGPLPGWSQTRQAHYGETTVTSFIRN